jgi:PAS domain S-box-containing protein
MLPSFESAHKPTTRFYVSVLVWAAVIALLYLTKRYNYPLFHPLAEMFSVAVAVAIFMLVWNVRQSLDNSYLLFVGVAYLFVGCLDMVHTIAYQGMGVFDRYETNLQTQLEIAGRYLQSLSLLIATFFLGRRLKPELVLAVYVAATALLLGAIFYWNVFPVCIVEGIGPTHFKRLSNYAVVLILAASIAILAGKRAQFDPAGLRFIIASIAFTILSELCLSFLADVYGIPYFLGHFFKALSFYFIYKALIELGMSKPFAVLFRNLKQSEDNLRRERDFIATILSTAGALVVILDREGRIVRFNRACERLTGHSFEQAEGRYFWDMFPTPEKAGSVRAVFGQRKVGLFPYEYESSWAAKDGSRRRIMWSNADLLDSGGSLEYVIATGIDITERQRAEEALKKAHDELELRVQQRTAELVEANRQLEQRIEELRLAEEALQMERNKFRTILEALPDGVYIVNEQHDIEYTNPAIEKEFGPVHGRKCHEYFHDSTETCPWCKNPQVFAGKTVQWEGHSDIKRKSYDFFDIPIFNTRGTVSKLKIVRDVTRHKQAEDKLRESEQQLRKLSSRLLTAQEDERSRIARELHDELGGVLAVLKLRTSSIEKNLQPDQTAVEEQCTQILHNIDQTIEDVHRLSRNLSPSILQNIGLTPALRWLIDNFVSHYGVTADADLENVDQLLPHNDQIMIYRTFQEALTNIGKHARAGNVAVTVKNGQDEIAFLVADDGLGFDVEALNSKTALEKVWDWQP